MKTSHLMVLTAIVPFAAATCPAHAELWPGDDPAISGAIVARMVAEKCGKLYSDDDRATLTAFIDTQLEKLKSKSSQEKDLLERAIPALEADYQLTLSCDDNNKELASDMIMRVRKFDAGMK